MKIGRWLLHWGHQQLQKETLRASPYNVLNVQASWPKNRPQLQVSLFNLDCIVLVTLDIVNDASRQGFRELWSRFTFECLKTLHNGTRSVLEFCIRHFHLSCNDQQFLDWWETDLSIWMLCSPVLFNCFHGNSASLTCTVKGLSATGYPLTFQDHFHDHSWLAFSKTMAFVICLKRTKVVCMREIRSIPGFWMRARDKCSNEAWKGGHILFQGPGIVQ